MFALNKCVLSIVIIFIISTINVYPQVKKPDENAKSKVSYIEVDAPSLESFENVKVGVYLPAEYNSSKERLPVVYFLGGFGQDETSWEKMGINVILDDLIGKKLFPPMIVVTPGSNDTGWVNWINGKYQWEEFLAKDLVKAIEAKYRTSANPSMRGISGSSAGGHGALVLGFKYPQVFGSISAHSAALHPENPDKLPEWAKNWDGWKERVGEPINVDFWKKQNPIFLANTLKKEQLEELSLYFDVGDKDHLGFAEPNISLSEALKKRGISHTFVLRSGGHGSQFVKDNSHFALEFHGKIFEQNRKKKE